VVLDHLVVLRAELTSYRTVDSPILRRMLNRFPPLPSSVFDADAAFDAEKNFELLYGLQMLPNIKQTRGRESAQEVRLPDKRGRGVRLQPYQSWGMVESVFRAEETDREGEVISLAGLAFCLQNP